MWTEPSPSSSTARQLQPCPNPLQNRVKFSDHSKLLCSEAPGTGCLLPAQSLSTAKINTGLLGKDTQHAGLRVAKQGALLGGCILGQCCSVTALCKQGKSELMGNAWH